MNTTNQSVISEGVWCAADGRQYEIGEMTDVHLFNTAKCIWNNVLCEGRVFGGEFIEWSFSNERYPHGLMKRNFDLMVEELERRGLNEDFVAFVRTP